MALANEPPSRSLSLIRSKISTWVSTAMPTVSTRPAIPGRVSTAPGSTASIPTCINRLAMSAVMATQPNLRYQAIMNSIMPAMPNASAVKPASMFCKPRVGPIERSSRILSGAVRAPARSSMASS